MISYILEVICCFGKFSLELISFPVELKVALLQLQVAFLASIEQLELFVLFLIHPNSVQWKLSSALGGMCSLCVRHEGRTF